MYEFDNVELFKLKETKEYFENCNSDIKIIEELYEDLTNNRPIKRTLRFKVFNKNEKLTSHQLCAIKERLKMETIC